MKKAGLKSRGGGGAGRGGKQPSYHAPPRHHANGHGGPADVGGAGGGVGNDFLRDQNHAPAGNGNPAAKPSYQKGSNFQPMTGGVGGGRATGAQGRHLQQQQPQHPLPQGPGGYPQHPQPQRGPYAPQHGGGAPARNGGGGPNALMRLRQQRQQTDEMAISQKNHRLAKELSDLRVRHREETQVVSRLTMENMNLASRCREAIAQVAALKKEILVYQKRQSEWGTLQREVMLLRSQIDKNAAATADSPSSIKSSRSGSREQKQPLTLSSSSSEERRLESKRSSSPATDLDRIMSQQFRKQEKSNVAVGTGSTMLSTAAEGGADGSTSEKKDGLGRKFQNLHISSPAASSQQESNTKHNIVLNGSHHSGESSTPSTSGNNSSSKHRPNSNAKIPISVNSSSSKTPSSQNDDEFDADIDMVDFFAKSQPALNSTSTNSQSTPGGDSSSIHHLTGRTRHARKPITADEHMPEDVVGGSSPSRKQGPLARASPPPAGDNLLSSLDAFEASFASAFPETSFSINSEAPLSSAKLDMSFDVPDFDPFFKSPTHSVRDGAPSSSAAPAGSKNNDDAMKSQMQDLFPESAMKFKPSSPNRSDNMVFDYSNPMNFPMELTSEKKRGKGSSSLAMGSEKADLTFLPTKTAAKGKSLFIATSDPSNKDGEKETSQPLKQRQRGSNRPSPLSPQSMSAEIEQLDVIAASLASSNAESSKAAGGLLPPPMPDPPSSRGSARSLRKVKQPVSYAEPSTKSKLRRGDVLFPKVDAAEKSKKMELESRSKGASEGIPTTDLDRIMGQMSDIR